MSNKYELNREDLKRIFRQVIIIYTPLIFLCLEQIQSWKFDNKVTIALIVSTSIDALRRYLTNYNK